MSNLAPSVGLVARRPCHPKLDMLRRAYFFGQSCKKLRRFTRVWNGLVPWIM